MDEEICALFKFENEQGVTAIGYMEWIDGDYDYSEVLNMKRKGAGVKVSWPKDLQITPPGSMSNKLTRCKWLSCIAIILDVGSKYNTYFKICIYFNSFLHVNFAFYSRIASVYKFAVDSKSSLCIEFFLSIL